MTPRARRAILAGGVVIVLLFTGRWTVSFVAERWWAATISPAVRGFVTTWQLLGLALDAGAIAAASAWFAIQALLVARTIASVQITRRLGDLQLREVVPVRLLMTGAILAGVLLGLIAGAGAHAWREPIVLAWQGVRYGVTDPLLHQDLGVFVAQLPAWDLAHRFAALLAVLGLGFCVMLYSSIGAIHRDATRIVVHPNARRHIGALLAVVALVIAAGYLLAPFHLAVAALPSLTPAGGIDRVHAAQLLAGISVATAVLTAWWAIRGRGTLLIATWLLLGAGAAYERFAVPVMAGDAPPTPTRLAALRHLDEVAWGIHLARQFTPADTEPSVTALWDEAMLTRLAERGGAVLEAATQVVSRDAGSVPMWLVATRSPDDSARLDVLAIADGATAERGAALLLQSPEQRSASRAIWSTVANPRARPAAGSWQNVRDGVDASGPLRRLVLAWARQAPGMLRAAPEPGVDWHLDPVERADAVLPMLFWLAADVQMVNRRITWIVEGMAVTPEFPQATRADWFGERVAGVVPAIICTVDAASGETHFYLDPGADSLGVAWAHLAATVVAPASAMPPDVRQGLGYSTAWFDAQATVFEGPLWNTGERAAGVVSDAPIWLDGRVGARQAVFDAPGHATLAAVVTASRVDGLPALAIDRDAGDVITDHRTELHQLWARAPVLVHLRDSVGAAGDSLLAGPTRWHTGRNGLVAWQPWFVASNRAPPRMLWISTASGEHVGGGRSPAEAWNGALQPGEVGSADRPDADAILDTAREWLQRADSAFRRGDLTAFGRAYEELRRTLAPRKP